VVMVEDEKGPESGVGTKEGDEEEDAERCRILSSRALLPLPLPLRALSFSLSPSVSAYLLCPGRFLSRRRTSFLRPRLLPCFHDLSSSFQ